jgi:hypothetical protein
MPDSRIPANASSYTPIEESAGAPAFDSIDSLIDSSLTGPLADETQYRVTEPLEVRTPRKRVRPAAVVIGVAVVVVLMMVLGPIVGGIIGRAKRANSSVRGPDVIAIPSAAPSSIAGYRLHPGLVQQNADWTALASNVAAQSTVSFSGVYGTYPPRFVPSTSTFFIIAARPRYGAGTYSDMNQEFVDMRASLGTVPGARFTVLPTRPSVLQGLVACAGAVVRGVPVGECWWESHTDFVLLTTLSTDLSADRAFTEQIVMKLRHPTTVA